MARSHWLVKSEPGSYAWGDLVRDGTTYWDGVRNYAARNHLAQMKAGDLVLYYHSQTGKEVVGIARITRSAYPDPTTQDERWVAVKVLVEKDRIQTVMDDLEKLGCTAILETELRHTRL